MARTDFGEGAIPESAAKLKRVVTEQVRFALGMRMPANWEVAVHEFDFGMRVAVAFSMFLLGCEIRTEITKTESVPATLWSHVLLRLPFLRRIFGAPRLRSISTEVKHWHVCPHIATENRRHVEFLIGE